MSALIPAIIQFVLSRRGGRGGGGGGGGGEGFDPSEYMRKYMTKQFLNEMDNIAQATRQYGAGSDASSRNVIRQNLSGGSQRLSPVTPGFFQNLPQPSKRQSPYGQ